MRTYYTKEYREKISQRMKEVWAKKRMEKALKEIEEKRKTEHCYVMHCSYLTERRCICLCAGCKAAKKKDR